jgi:hypothetical protein
MISFFITVPIPVNQCPLSAGMQIKAVHCFGLRFPPCAMMMHRCNMGTVAARQKNRYASM